MSETLEYSTRGGLAVTRVVEPVSKDAVEPLMAQLDDHRGVVLSSTFEYPGRYSRWDFGFVDPPLCISAHERTVSIEALNGRGQVLLQALNDHFEESPEPSIAVWNAGLDITSATVRSWRHSFTEEERTRQPSVFSVLRYIIEFFSSPEHNRLGLYGAFGYDLAFQFEPVSKRMVRSPDQRDLVVYIPDRLVVVDRMRDVSERFDYDFDWRGQSTHNMQRTGEVSAFVAADAVASASDHAPNEYADIVRDAIVSFERGNLFEVVPSQTFSESQTASPSEIFKRLRVRNPAPYGALMNLGQSEYLVAASPEMYVRVEGTRVETCPIAGTIARGNDVLSDADRIIELLNSEKDANELTMCTDVDRNDKSRVCDPASIRVIGRRQIEVYSRLIHTVDHVEGTLLPQYDALDAFLTHTWAVTVTGAPKLWAMRFIEEHEKSPRAWYGGAIGALTFDGNINTGLTLRTVWLKNGVASVRAGATLLIDSDPDAEERETRTKASALLDAIRRPDSVAEDKVGAHATSDVGNGLKVLLIDHEDSFVHTLAGYLRRTGAEVTTVRVPLGGRTDAALIQNAKPDVVVLSPGPGRPEDFHLHDTIQHACDAAVPIFGVCLGLQGLVEYFGGHLDQLDYPAHGRPSKIKVTGGRLFSELPNEFEAGRYHSLIARHVDLPSNLIATAQTEDNVIMAIEHATLPIAAVQFHPESMMTLKDDAGMRILEGFIQKFVRAR
jgi:anthranilate synthase